jgi:hypothetical protein
VDHRRSQAAIDDLIIGARRVAAASLFHQGWRTPQKENCKNDHFPIPGGSWLPARRIQTFKIATRPNLFRQRLYSFVPDK